jgi:YYY domain-containing protein
MFNIKITLKKKSQPSSSSTTQQIPPEAISPEITSRVESNPDEVVASAVTVLASPSNAMVTGTSAEIATREAQKTHDVVTPTIPIITSPNEKNIIHVSDEVPVLNDVNLQPPFADQPNPIDKDNQHMSAGASELEPTTESTYNQPAKQTTTDEWVQKETDIELAPLTVSTTDVPASATPTSQITPQPKPRNTRSVITRVMVVLAIVVLAGSFRFNNINWDQGHLLHPDERYIAILAGQLKTPNSWVDFFSAGKSTLNPFNTEWGRGYVYGTLPVFIVRQLGDVLNMGCGKDGNAILYAIASLIYGDALKNCAPNFFDGANITRLGRVWSGIADILSVLLIGLMGLRLFGWRAGLLASIFTALSVMLIQQSHFFTVDATANMFIVLALYACSEIILAAQRQRRMWLFAGLAGLATGAALASKISAWPLVPIIVLACVLNLVRDRRAGNLPIYNTLFAFIIAGVITFLSFRVGQPYAFVGPGEDELAKTQQQCRTLGDKTMFGQICAMGLKLPSVLQPIIALSGHWLQRMTEAERLASGEIDVPFGHQWTNRAPITFPLINLVFWGLGLPLGIAVIIGYAYSLRQLLKGRRWWAYVLPVLWVGAFFIYQSTQHVKSMRYLLPIYPFACLLAAVGLLALWRQTPRITFIRPLPQWVKAMPMFIVMIGSTVWALMFSQIYSVKVPRIQASEWIFRNVPTAITLRWSDDKDDYALQLPGKALTLAPNRPERVVINFSDDLIKQENLPAQLSSPRFVFNKLNGSGNIRAQLKQTDNRVIAESQALVSDFDKRNEIVFGGVTLSISPGANYLLELSNDANAPISAKTTIMANEHWDDGLPLSIAGRNAFGSYYDGLKTSSDGQMQNYAEDEPSKLNNMLNWLDEVDYLNISSNRLYASIPRLPWRFPLTTEYYRSLFSGELGFELAADFNSMPRVSLPGIGTINFNTQEMPFELVYGSNTTGTPSSWWFPYPPAEEAFSVYDHPNVFIFRKTANYSRAKAQAILGKYDLNDRVVQTPLKAASSPGGLIFNQSLRESQQEGGTWRTLFPINSPLNQSQFLAWLGWLLLIQLFGWATFPTLYRISSSRSADSIAPALIDGGYAVAKTAGILVTAVTSWWLASLHWVQFSAAALWAILLVWLGIGIFNLYRTKLQLSEYVRDHAKLLIAAEVVFLVSFIGWTWVRSQNPDLWHPVMGGEKPMDFAYLNGVLKSTYFPPIDPWFAHGYLNYYYLGWVIFGTPIKMLGIDPSIAYNLLIPTLFALTASGAFGVAATLKAKYDRYYGSPFALKPIVWAGVLAAMFVVLLGNGGEIETILPAFRQMGQTSPDTSSFSAIFNGIIAWLGGKALPVRPEWPYWNPTRLTPNVPIAEFPQFTFLYADLHAHMMSMPIVMLALVFVLIFAGGVRKLTALIFGALVVGALWPVNTWDYPIYVLLAVAGLVVGRMPDAHKPQKNHDWRLFVVAFARSIPVVVLFVLATRAWFIPYLENYGSAYNAVEAWKAERTPLYTYITIYTTFAVPIIAYLINGIVQMMLGYKNAKQTGLVGVMITLAVTAYLWQMGASVAIIAVPIAFMALLAAIMPNTAAPTRIMWLMVAGAFALTIFVELYTLRGDIGRMNTVFKFYLQAWILLAIVAAVCVTWLFQTVHQAGVRAKENATAQTIQIGFDTFRIGGLQLLQSIFIGAAFLAALYPLFAIPAKMNDRYVENAPRGLDGMAYMPLARRSEGQDGKPPREFSLKGDYEAIMWMRENVVGSPIIMETTTGGAQYRWGNRFSIYTGLPSVVGWEWHQRQQRGSMDDRIVFSRNKDVGEFYSTTELNRAISLLKRYDAKYVILGDLEKAYHPAPGIAKFDTLVANGILKVAYQNQDTTIFEVK